MPQLFISVSGSRGHDGGRGQDGADGALGQSGLNGGPGGHGGDGLHAGSVDVTLSVNNQQIIVSGEVAPAGKQRSSYKNSLPLGDAQNNLVLEAIGGAGGDGGRGGNGGTGGRGVDGQDATRYHSGTNGGTGGRGGDGGPGGHAGNGGNGGILVVRCDERDMDTLMVLNNYPKVDGGAAGKAGPGGNGGHGGHGGSGGQSFHWTEQETRTGYDGANRSNYTYTVSVPHVNPGGAPGHFGKGGKGGPAGRHGSSGSPGAFRLYVNHTEYKWRYNLLVNHAKYYPEKQDGIIEPGCLVHLFTTYENKELCPTPIHQNVYGYLHETSWVTAPTKVPLKRGITGTTTIDKPIEFRVTNVNKPAQGEPLRATGVMDHRAYVERVNLQFPDVIPQTTEFSIQYPVELAPVRSASAISITEEAPVVILFENFSTVGIGRKTKNGRVLRLRIHVADAAHQVHGVDQVPRDKLSFILENGDVIRDETFTYEIENLKAKSREHLAFTVKFDPSVEPYSFAVLTVSLDLGSIDNFSQYKTIQERTFQIQLAESYAVNPNAKTLLVVNGRSVKDEIEAWKSLFERLNMEMAIYNLSLYRGLDTKYKRISDGKTLIDDFAGSGLIIILNNRCRDHDSNDEKSPLHDFTNLYPLQLIQQFGIRLLVLGGSDISTNLLLPLPDACFEQDPSFHFKSTDHFFKTGIDRVSYHLHQSQKIDGIFYTETKEETTQELPSDLKRKRVPKRESCRESRLVKRLSCPDLKEQTSSFLSVAPEISVCKGAQVDSDFSGFLMKKRKYKDAVSKISGWQKRFFTLRLRDRTFSWYLSPNAKNPKGVLDLSQSFTVKIVPPKDESKESRSAIFTISTATRSLTLKGKKTYVNSWIDNFYPLQENENREPVLKKKPSDALNISPQVHGDLVGVDDVFYGWVTKKARLLEKKRFLVLRLHSMSLSVYSGDNLWIPEALINANLIKVVPGWVKQIKLPVSESQQETEMGSADPEKFTIMTPWKHYFFKANIERQPSAEQWLKHLNDIHIHFQEARKLLSSQRYISAVPERHAVIPTNDKLMFWKSPNRDNLLSRAKGVAKKLTTKFPCRRCLVVAVFDENSVNKHLKTGSPLRPKHFLGVLKIFESLPAIDSGFVVHHIPEENFHESDMILSTEMFHYVMKSIPFEDRAEKLRRIDLIADEGVCNAIISSIISDLVTEIAMCRRTTHSLSEQSMQFEFRLLNYFTQFNWTVDDASRVCDQPILEGTVVRKCKLEGALIEIIGALKSILAIGSQKISNVTNLWSNNGIVIKLFKIRIRFLVDRITRLYTKEEKKEFKNQVKEKQKLRKNSFIKASSPTKCIYELQYPFGLNKSKIEENLTNYAADAIPVKDTEFNKSVEREENRPGRSCEVTEQGNSCDSPGDRRKILEKLLAA